MRKTLRDNRDDWRRAADIDEDAERQTKALAGLALTLALALLGCYLVLHLRAVAKIEDCLLAQYTNCDGPIDPR
jgi:hypothetical protein